MDKPTLLIGIGTSGLRVLEQVQNFYYESTGTNRPAHAQFLYLETDENARPGVTALKNEITRVHISLNEKETMINSLKKEEALDAWWLPPSRHILDSGFGAGGLPAFGRVALWGAENFDNVSKQILNAYEKVASHTVEDSNDSKPAVFVTGSLTGGTGTGTFIDIAYLIRNLFDDIADLYGLFMIPGRTGYDGKEIIYANTYASLKMLEHFNKIGNGYKLRWPNGHKANFDQPPYEFVQFISQDYNGDVPSISSLTGLYKMAGMYLFLNVFGLRKKRLVRFGDAKGNQHLDKYGTFGLSAIQYPKSQLEEHLAIQLTEEVLNRWVDANNYFNQGNLIPIQKSRHLVLDRTKRNFEKFLREAFTELDATEVRAGRSIINDLKEKTRTLKNKEYEEGSPEDFIRSNFSSSVAANYYSAVKNNLRAAEDILIEKISELIIHATDQFENLIVVREHLEAIVQAIDETTNYWISIKVSGRPDKWELVLNSQVNWMLKNRYQYLFQGDNVLEDRMRSTLELMKMHLFANKLVDIKKCITQGEIILKSNNGVDLPTVKQIDHIIGAINATLGKSEDSKLPKNFKTLKTRREEIKNDIGDVTIPILRVFPSGSVSEELSRSLDKYRRGINNSIPGKSALIGQNELWNYLIINKSDLHDTLYKDGIRSFEAEIRKYESVPDMNISDFVRKEPDESIKIANRATYPLVKINSDKETLFGNSMYLPKMVIGQSKAMVEDVLSLFKEERYLEFNASSDDGIWVDKDLKNLLVFYEERGYMQDKTTFNPLKHLRFIREIEDIYSEYPELKRISAEEWHMLRIPYYKFEPKQEKA